MKTSKINIVLFLGIISLTGITITSCNKEPQRGTPKIDYIRMTDPEKADSTFKSAFMGQL